MKTLALAVLVLLAPIAVSAQTTPGPLVVERVHTPFVVAPDYKITDLDGETGQLAGGYVGRVIADAVFIGGAGYWLVNGSGGDELAYGGVVAGWSMPAGSRIRFGGRGLVGFGHGKLGTDVLTQTRAGVAGGGRDRARFDDRGQVQTLRFALHDDFFVFEPQADAVARIASHAGVRVAGGYRLTGATDALEDRLNGVTGSVALQLEW
jgi:hypothetical protein